MAQADKTRPHPRLPQGGKNRLPRKASPSATVKVKPHEDKKYSASAGWHMWAAHAVDPVDVSFVFPQCMIVISSLNRRSSVILKEHLPNPFIKEA